MRTPSADALRAALGALPESGPAGRDQLRDAGRALGLPVDR